VEPPTCFTYTLRVLFQFNFDLVVGSSVSLIPI
jgi:hypothetical protein